MQLPIGSIRKLTGSIYESDEGIQNFFYLQIQELFFSRLKRSAEEDIGSHDYRAKDKGATPKNKMHIWHQRLRMEDPADGDHLRMRRGEQNYV